MIMRPTTEQIGLSFGLRKSVRCSVTMMVTGLTTWMVSFSQLRRGVFAFRGGGQFLSNTEHYRTRLVVDTVQGRGLLQNIADYCWSTSNWIAPLTLYQNLSFSITFMTTSADFSRSYCFTVGAAIGIIMCSVRPSARLSVMLCIVLSGSVYMAKSCTSVFLAGKFLFVCSDTSAVGCIV